MNALKEIYMNINKLGVYGKTYSYGFSPNLYLTRDDNIGWCHYGSSANKNTLEELKWVIETIFDTTPEEFIKEYQLKEWR